ncbi:hypothetical protein [Bradyrhizobium sp.]|uniref:hypothetical protein n=1 Tax=Bradyrhizobium sp. TaxID=376 RepID=UPI001EB3F180|nr:hypothetical protein [Bradyrhizobium sp.]MBV8771494.1 hypothetical protein [Deltaproteobacteria bacterium]MBV9983476.1 hypothetical protein [Bradyrhizobium sp.]
MSDTIRAAAREMARHAIAELTEMLQLADAYLADGNDNAAIGTLLSFEGVRDMQGSVVPQSHAATATRMIEAIRAHMDSCRQMMLF